MNAVLERERVRCGFEVPPTESGIAAARTSLMAVLRGRGLSEARCFSLELCVQEALVNALVHGIQEQGGRRITLACEADDARVRVTVEDDGSGFDWVGACAGRLDRAARPAKPGGRGLLLVRAMMSRVLFNPSGNGITMEMDLAGSSRGRHAPIEQRDEASYPGQEIRPGR
jgi:anti-sigma regulatory factor (Ser/Thr protein kinase)